MYVCAGMCCMYVAYACALGYAMLHFDMYERCVTLCDVWYVCYACMLSICVMHDIVVCALLVFVMYV